MSIVSCKSLVKKYGNRPVVDALDFDVEAGESVALTGPSGSGKSTLLHCIGGVTSIDGGYIRVGDIELSRCRTADRAFLRREVIGNVFQFFHLLPTLTVEENIEFPLLIKGIDADEAHTISEELMDRVGITHRGHAFPDELSGGELQRTAIARALAPRPLLLLADEPTGNLDSQSGEAVLQLLQEVVEERSMTLIMVTHSTHAASICPRQCQLLDGKFVTDSAPSV